MSRVLAALRNLSVRYGGSERPALDGIDLDIVEGERLAVIGESGSGKSTLALALAGLLPPGAALAGGMEWPGLGHGHGPLPGRDIGFVFQDASASLNPVLSVGEQVAEVVVRHGGAGWADATRQAVELLERVKLPEPERLVRAYPHQLSGGQRQRVAIASAVAAKPRLLIADEPTSALDTIVQAQIVELLDGLVRESGMTLVFITHDIALASGFADRVAVFHDARLVEAGTTAALLEAPKEDYTRRLIASHIDLETKPLVAA